MESKLKTGDTNIKKQKTLVKKSQLGAAKKHKMKSLKQTEEERRNKNRTRVE